MYALVYINHESMEVYTSFLLDVGRQGFEEQVHKHGLASAYIAVKIQAGRRLGRRRCRRTTVEEARELRVMGECQSAAHYFPWTGHARDLGRLRYLATFG